jgi:hypothetical protein
MIDLLPVVKLSDNRTCEPWRYTRVGGVVVRLKDLLCYPYLIKKIEDKGSVHNYLNYNGKVYLSGIMNDKYLKNTPVNKYYELIELLKPDYYFTPDTQTYEKEDSVSFKNIESILADTENLLNMHTTSKPIGLVKGSNPGQIIFHASSLKEIGINDMVFHNGDFIYKSTKYDKTIAKHYAKLIKEYTDSLYIYGIGPGMFEKYSFADHFITQSHTTAAFNGKVYDNNKWRFSDLDIGNRIMETLIGMESKLDYINRSVRRLDQWAAEAEAAGVAAEAVTPHRVMAKTQR